MTAAMPLPRARAIILSRLSLGYGGKPVVEDVSGLIPEGKLLALVGPNGAGKSTLLKAFAGLHRPMTGSLSGAAGAELRPAYMPQHSEIDRSFPMSVLDFVAMGLWRDIGWWKPLTQARLLRTRAALARVGLAGVETQRVGALSGGQLRRALFARASLQETTLMLLDEPFAGVDAATAEDLLSVIRGWHAEGRTVIAALHDLNQVRTHFPSALLLAHQVVGWGDPAQVLTDVNLATARRLCTSGEISDTTSDRLDDV